MVGVAGISVTGVEGIEAADKAGLGEKYEGRSFGGGEVKNVWRVWRREDRVVVRDCWIWDCWAGVRDSF